MPAEMRVTYSMECWLSSNARQRVVRNKRKHATKSGELSARMTRYPWSIKGAKTMSDQRNQQTQQGGGGGQQKPGQQQQQQGGGQQKDDQQRQQPSPMKSPIKVA